MPSETPTMSDTESAVLDCIRKAIGALNEERGPGEQIAVADDTCLFGAESDLDSLALVSVIVDLETLVSDHFGRPVSLTDDKAMSRQPVPFVDIGTLKAYLLECLAE
jgi:acyl carrier protein